MKNNKFALQIVAFGLIILSFIACDKDFATLESDLINEGNATNFDIKKDSFNIIAFTQALGPVQTNGLGLNTLGIYDDTYGRTTSSFLTQVNASTYDPVFGEGVSIDSVVLTIPYFSTITDIDEDENLIYDVDSILPEPSEGVYKPIRLRLFENNYFIRDFDPNGEFNESQDYFSNKSASETETISDAALEGEEIGFVEYDDEGNITPVDNIIDINEEGYTLTIINDEDETEVSQRLSPGIRVKLDTTFWRNKIINREGETELSSQNNFTNYFRGLYFKAEPVDDDGSFLILNVGAQTSNIIIYYTRLTASTTDDPDETEQGTYQLSFGPNRINFMDNEFTSPIEDGDSETGDSRIYLKGGQGSLARIKLFNGDDTDDDPEMNAFETFKNTFVETDEDGNFVKSKKLINEANLIFYVDQDIVQDGEPNRIYLYDIENKTPLFDYFADLGSSSLPSFSKINHLGPLQRVDDEPNGNGIKYKLKITEHINDLLIRDSTNVDLGLAVSINVNLEESFAQRKVQDADDSEFTSPISSIITPRGTVLHGNTSEDESKRVYLEIYYTCLNEDDDCNQN
ncbi:DUF4270 domain-containing protein [Winogradskyella echinorum]|uniref:DUF4270 domain-containing protein n=1 Tax=Winogradskyella echinorum TaxID=538189 RepID=A0ABR6XY82_9FLAO|nr:DUF4270 domain-containing protein [Winogradskyella echinorum]MBC3845453.1 DUF4270 domain-containing protein [Winogradskyella echinorum]MBC5749801.1 DUF4270 domain-containing protein [Winogradskyella echinorum]